MEILNLKLMVVVVCVSVKRAVCVCVCAECQIQRCASYAQISCAVSPLQCRQLPWMTRRLYQASVSLAYSLLLGPFYWAIAVLSVTHFVIVVVVVVVDIDSAGGVRQ